MDGMCNTLNLPALLQKRIYLIFQAEVQGLRQHYNQNKPYPCEEDDKESDSFVEFEAESHFYKL